MNIPRYLIHSTPDDVVLATFDVSSLYTNIPQSEGIDVIFRHYQDHYEKNYQFPQTTCQKNSCRSYSKEILSNSVKDT